MGKSSKKSATKVEAAAVVPVTQSGKKGKRGAENVVEKAVSAKKQKVERDETVIAKQKAAKKQPKKVESSSSEEESDVSDSDNEPKVVAKKAQTPAKNGSVVAKKADTSSDSDSDSSGSDSDAKPAAKKPVVAAAKNGSVAVKKMAAAESSSSDSDSDEDDEKPAAAVTNGTAKAAAKDSSSDSDSDSSDDEVKAKQPKKTITKPAASDSDSDDSSSDEDDAKPAPAAKAKADSSDDSSDDEESSDEDEPKATKAKAAAKESESSDDSSDDESEDEEQKTPKKKDTDVKMVDAPTSFQKTPKTPSTPEVGASKTLFMGNLSFSIEESDVLEFFKDCGEVVGVRFAMGDGQFKGFGHVEFATAEAAQKGLELTEQNLVGRPVRLDLARERGAATPQSRDGSFQRGGRGPAQGQTAYVRGFDVSIGEDAIRSQLEEHFASCGEVTRISIPPDHETGLSKGMAYIDFADSNGINAAIALDGENGLTVQEAKPRGDSAGGGGGRFGGGRSGGRGRFGGGRGDRDGGRGGRFSGGRGGGGRAGGRGGRTPFRSTVPSGKKTTFGDD